MLSFWLFYILLRFGISLVVYHCSLPLLKKKYSLKIRPFAPLSLQKFLHYYGFCWLPTWLALLPLHFVPSQLLSRRISQGKFSIFQSNWHILLPLFYVQLLGFAIQCSLTHNVSLIICFSPFSHFFAACFLQILNYSRHPCIKLTIPVGRLVGDSHSLDSKHAWRTKRGSHCSQRLPK